MRSLSLILAIALSGCDCGGGKLSNLYGQLVVVERDSSGGERLTSEGTLALDPTFMDTVSVSELTVRNVGRANVSILSVDRLEGDASISLEAEGLVIATAKDVAIPARFAPTQALDPTIPEVEHRAKFSLKLSGTEPSESEVLIEVVGRAVARDCLVPARIDFGKVPLFHAVELPLVFENGRALPSLTTFGALSGTDANAFFIDAHSPLEIAAGGRSEVQVRFSPLDERSYESTLTVRRDAQCPEGQVHLVGEGDEQALTWTPSALAFGRIPLGTAVTKTVALVNKSNANLSLSASALSPHFTLENAPLLVPPNATVQIDVSCRPQQLGALSDTLTLNIGTSPLTPARIALTCTGGGPRIRVDPSTLQFGQVPLSPTGSVQTRRRLVVQNVGTAPTSPSDTANNLFLGRDGAVPWFAIIPKNAQTRASEFTVGLHTPYDNSIGLPARIGRNFVEFEVMLSPTSPGLREADLLVYSNDAKDPVTRVPIIAIPRAPERCELSIEPAGANFGPTPRGSTLTRSLTLHNTSLIQGSVCLVSGIEMAPGSHLAFQVTSPQVSSLLIQQGQSVNVEVQATVPADATIGDYLRGTLRMNVSGEADLRALPVDLQVSRCLVIDPPEVNLGVVQTGCVSGPQSISLYNVCGVPITVTGLSTPSVPFRLTSGPTIPVTIAPSDQVHLQVTVAPTAAGFVGDVLNIDTQEGNVMSTQGVALRATSDAVGMQDEQFTQAGAEVDILFVVDDSCSMADEQAALARNFAAFLSSASNGAGNWRIGVTTTDTVNRRGALVNTPNNPRFLTPTTSQVATLFAEKVQVGTSGNGTEQPFMAMAMAVTEPNLSETNLDFLRPNAVLAVIIVTDAVEQSPNSVGSYLAILRAAKGNRTELVSVSVVGPFSPHSATCITEGLVDSGRYLSAIAATGGVQADICTSSWSTDLENISRNVFGARRRFELSSAVRNPPEITVTVGGNPNSAWHFEPATNAVLFDSTPAPGAQITIRYRTACF